MPRFFEELLDPRKKNTYAIEALKVGQETEIVVRRKEEVFRFKVTPQSRQ